MESAENRVTTRTAGHVHSPTGMCKLLLDNIVLIHYIALEYLIFFFDWNTVICTYINLILNNVETITDKLFYIFCDGSSVDFKYPKIL